MKMGLHCIFTLRFILYKSLGWQISDLVTKFKGSQTFLLNDLDCLNQRKFVFLMTLMKIWSFIRIHIIP